MSSPDPRSTYEDMTIEGPCKTDPYTGQEEMESIHETLEGFRRTLVEYGPKLTVHSEIQSVWSEIETLKSEVDDVICRLGELEDADGSSTQLDDDDLEDKIKSYIRKYMRTKFSV